MRAYPAVRGATAARAPQLRIFARISARVAYNHRNRAARQHHHQNIVAWQSISPAEETSYIKRGS